MLSIHSKIKTCPNTPILTNILPNKKMYKKKKKKQAWRRAKIQLVTLEDQTFSVSDLISEVIYHIWDKICPRPKSKCYGQ